MKHIDGLTAGDAFQILQEAYAQQQDRLNSNAAVILTVASL
jgi:hypothetical protein